MSSSKKKMHSKTCTMWNQLDQRMSVSRPVSNELKRNTAPMGDWRKGSSIQEKSKNEH